MNELESVVKCRPMGLENWNARLLAFDATYFDDDEPKEALTQEEASYDLATWLFDKDFEINEKGWKLLKSIKKNLPELFDKTLENIFKGHHDT